MNYVPVNDPLPPDDSHTWARPASPPCPDCECCSAALCARSIERDTACHWEGSSPDFDLARCPCWRRGSKARLRLAGGANE